MEKQVNDIKYKKYKNKIILTYITFLLYICVIVLSVLSILKILSFVYPLIIFILNTILIKYRNNIDLKNKE